MSETATFMGELEERIRTAHNEHVDALRKAMASHEACYGAQLAAEATQKRLLALVEAWRVEEGHDLTPPLKTPPDLWEYPLAIQRPTFWGQ